MISEVVKYTNVASVTDESVLFMEVFLIQWCPYREAPNTVYIYLYMYIYSMCCIGSVELCI